MRVGLRRFAHQQCSMPSSLIPSESIHQVVLGAASRAFTTRTRFDVFIKPRWDLLLLDFSLKAPCVLDTMLNSSLIYCIDKNYQDASIRHRLQQIRRSCQQPFCSWYEGQDEI